MESSCVVSGCFETYARATHTRRVCVFSHRRPRAPAAPSGSDAAFKHGWSAPRGSTVMANKKRPRGTRDQSQKTEKCHRSTKKKVPSGKRARRVRTSSLRSESSLSLSRRFSASISCAASSAISNAKTSHCRETAPRASVSFPVVPASVGLKKATVRCAAGRFLVRARAAVRRRSVSRGGTRARRGLELVVARRVNPGRSNPGSKPRVTRPGASPAVRIRRATR